MKFNKFIPILFSIEPIILTANGEEKEWRKKLFIESQFTGRDTPFSEGIKMGDWKFLRIYRQNQ